MYELMICIVCGAQFIRNQPTRKCCSPACSRARAETKWTRRREQLCAERLAKRMAKAASALDSGELPPLPAELSASHSCNACAEYDRCRAVLYSRNFGARYLTLPCQAEANWTDAQYLALRHQVGRHRDTVSLVDAILQDAEGAQ